MTGGIGIRMLKQWDLVESRPPVHIFWVPSSIYYPLSGHSGSCAKVTTATVTGRTDAACTCGVQP